MKYRSAFIPLLLTLCSCQTTTDDSEHEEDITNSLSHPKAWFDQTIQAGYTGEKIKPVLATGNPPIKIKGADLIALIGRNKFSAAEVASDPRFKSAIMPDSEYWYWTRQGPMSDHQMHIVLSGNNLDESLVIYAKIQTRPCL